MQGNGNGAMTHRTSIKPFRVLKDTLEAEAADSLEAAKRPQGNGSGASKLLCSAKRASASAQAAQVLCHSYLMCVGAAGVISARSEAFGKRYK